MYANLAVSVNNADPVFAWRVEVTPEEVVIHLDDNQGESYSVEAGEQRVSRDAHVAITADF